MSQSELAKLCGREMQGNIASINQEFNYGFVELSDGSGLQFILKTTNFPGVKLGMPVRFTIDEGGAVNKMGMVRTAEQDRAP